MTDPSLDPPAHPPPAAVAGLDCSGVVYGILLNVAADIASRRDQFSAPPYQALPQAPILYVKPANTRIGHGGSVTMPAGATRLTVGVTLGLVIGATASRRTLDDALAVVAGVVLVIDLSILHDSLHRPAIREKCFDGACPVGSTVVPLAALPALDTLVVHAMIDGARRSETRFDGLVRPIPQLIADVTAFLTLHPGDVLLAGMPLVLPEAGPGQTVGAVADGLGTLEVRLVTAGVA